MSISLHSFATEHLLVSLQCALAHLLRLVHLALVSVEIAQVVDRGKC
jgi:hypothetical protein